MRFFMMHKNDPRTEAGEPPPMEIVRAMGAYVQEHVKAGRILDGAGLQGSKSRTRLVFRGGRSTILHGPYRGENELPATVLLLQVRTREEAIGWAERYGKILGDGEIELGKVTEPWDLGLVPRPENPPLQMLLIEKADAATESGGRSPKQKAELTRLATEMTKAGMLVRKTKLLPSANAKRLFFQNDELRVVDGPFPETKELLGGFAVLEMPSMEAAIEESRRYAKILGGNLEIDLRLVDTSDDEA